MKSIVKFTLFSAAVLFAIACTSAPKTDSNYEAFNRYFTDSTLRIDFWHSGNDTSENFAIAKYINDGPWAGRTAHLLDKWELGLYFIKVIDQQSGEVIYSQGYNSVFGEWQTTAEAQKSTQKFMEAFRIPWPKTNVTVQLEKRDANNTLQPIWNFNIDAKSIVAEKRFTDNRAKLTKVMDNGDPKCKADIVIVGDGYTANDTAVFNNDVKTFVDAFFGTEPFLSRKSDFNVWSVFAPSPKEGINLQEVDYHPENILGTSFYTFGIERYVLSNNEWTVKDYASVAPYDFLVILMNTNKYGGGGIFNLYITAAAHSPHNQYVMVHEMGHHIAGLADEYYTSDVAYAPANTKVEPWEFNVTALLNPDSLKWADLVAPGTPIPTPWQKDEYEKGNTSVLHDSTLVGKVGAYEGGNYLSKGMYRPEVNCIMFSKNKRFCKVCTRGINRIIDLYVN